MQERILVTGATGTVGTAVIKKLSNLNMHIRAGVHSLIKGENLKYPNVELCEMEFHKPELLRAAFTGIDRVFMITPFSPEQEAVGKQLIDMAVACKVKHVVKLSAIGAGNEGGIQMCRWHRAAEQHLEQSGIPYTILRPNTFLQNFVNFYGQSIRTDNAIYLPLGDGKVSYVDVRDIAEIAAEVLTTDRYFNQTLEITGPEPLSVQDVAQAISEATNRPVQYVNVPEDQARQAMLDMQMPGWMVDSMMELHGISKAGEVAKVEDTTERVTGHKGHTVQDFARQYASCFQPD